MNARFLFGPSGQAQYPTAVSTGLLILRLSLGALMIYGHGWGKLSGYAEMLNQFPDPLGLGGPVTLTLAVFAEFFCSILLILGLFTRFATLPLIATMLTAVIVIHAEDPWQRKEFALLYLMPYLSLLAAGAGAYSLDAKFGK